MAPHLNEPSDLWLAHRPRALRVIAVHAETRDVTTLYLETTPSFAFAAGQFNMLYVFGVGEAAISISGSPSAPHRLVHTIRSVGAVTRAICSLRLEDRLGVRGPFGTPWPLAEARGRDIVVLAGGLGLAPLRPALYHLLENRGEFGHIALLYGARTPGDLLFADELHEWRGRFDLQVDVTVDSDHFDSPWHGNVGVVTDLLPRIHFDAANTVAFVCGPEIMMRFAADALLARGIAAERVYLSTERNMRCALGHCGHCQFGPDFVCKDGPVFAYSRVARRLRIREL